MNITLTKFIEPKHAFLEFLPEWAIVSVTIGVPFLAQHLSCTVPVLSIDVLYTTASLLLLPPTEWVQAQGYHFSPPCSCRYDHLARFSPDLDRPLRFLASSFKCIPYLRCKIKYFYYFNLFYRHFTGLGSTHSRHHVWLRAYKVLSDVCCAYREGRGLRSDDVQTV